MSKPTRGPWDIKTFTNLARNEDRLHIMASNKRMIAMIANHPGECASLDEHISAEDRANAQLIASAPAMLDFIKRVVTEQASMGDHGDAVIISEGQSLINRAGG